MPRGVRPYRRSREDRDEVDADPFDGGESADEWVPRTERPDPLVSDLADPGCRRRRALAILRLHRAGFGSYEGWDAIVRRAVWFASGRDCRTTQREVNAEAPERNENMALIEGLSELPGTKRGERGVTIEQALKLVNDNPLLYDLFRTSLMSRGRAGKPADSRQIGNSFKMLTNMTIGGFRLIKHPLNYKHAVCWIVDRPTPSGESGESGESVLSASLQNFASHKDAIEWAYNTKNVLVGALTDSSDSPDSPPDPDRGDAWEPPDNRQAWDGTGEKPPGLPPLKPPSAWSSTAIR